MEGHYYKHQQLEPCREGLGTRLTKGLIGRPLLQTPTTAARQGRPGDEAITKGLIGRPLLQTPTTGAMQGRPGDEANQRSHWKATTTNTNNLEPCREGLGTRLTKDLIGRPLLQTSTTGAMQGRPGDEANQRPHWKATTTNTNNWSHAGKAWGRG